MLRHLAIQPIPQMKMQAKNLPKLALACLLVWATAQQAQAAEAVADAAAGAAAYSRTCAYCHNPEAGAPALLGRHLSPDYVRTTVRSGLGPMPAFRPTEITKDELDALAAMISASAAPGSAK
jgi:mono/diheme cytochrome c family protein